MNSKKKIREFVLLEKSTPRKKKYDMCVDRYVTVGFENSGTKEKGHRKHLHLKTTSSGERETDP